MRDVEAGESERLYRPVTGPVKRRELGGLREIEILFEEANSREIHERSKLLKKKLMKDFILDND